MVQILDQLVPNYTTVNVLADPELREGIKQFSQWPTIPQVYVRGEFIGGSDIVREMFASEKADREAPLGASPSAEAIRAVPLDRFSSAQAAREASGDFFSSAEAVGEGSAGFFSSAEAVGEGSADFFLPRSATGRPLPGA